MTADLLDLVIKDLRLVRPGQPSVEPMDLGVKDGRFLTVQRETPARDGREIFDARGASSVSPVSSTPIRTRASTRRSPRMP